MSEMMTSMPRRSTRRHWRLWSVLHRVENRLYWFRFAWKHPRHLSDGNWSKFEVSASTVWEPRNLWVGIYWTPSGYKKLLVYICMLPCLPLRLHFKRIYGSGGPT